jgi:hypothetical protein
MRVTKRNIAGKFKFIGKKREGLAYIKSFLINQPIPTKAGWAAAQLPAWLHRILLVKMCS